MNQCSRLDTKEVVWVFQSVARDAFWFGGLPGIFVDCGNYSAELKAILNEWGGK